MQNIYRSYRQGNGNTIRISKKHSEYNRHNKPFDMGQMCLKIQFDSVKQNVLNYKNIIFFLPVCHWWVEKRAEIKQFV